MKLEQIENNINVQVSTRAITTLAIKDIGWMESTSQSIYVNPGDIIIITNYNHLFSGKEDYEYIGMNYRTQYDKDNFKCAVYIAVDSVVTINKINPSLKAYITRIYY